MSNKLEFVNVIIQVKLGGNMGFQKFEELVESVAKGDEKIREYLSKGYVYQWGKSENQVTRDYYPPHQIEKAKLVLKYKEGT